VAATNRDLMPMIAAGMFREDLSTGLLSCRSRCRRFASARMT